MGYRSGPALDAARKDVENLAAELKKLQFKVFSYIDLSVEDMRKAVEIFCELITKDVYGNYQCQLLKKYDTYNDIIATRACKE